MLVIPPITITDAILTSSTAAEPGPGETAWNAATSYAKGDRVYLASNHTRYERLIAGTTATSPASDTTNWFELGPTNRWACLDLDRNTGTTVSSPLTIVLTPGQRFDSVAFVGMSAEAVSVTLTVSGSTVYSYSANLSTRVVANWYDYYLSAFGTKTELLLTDLPPFSNGVLTVSLTSTTGTVSLGGLVIGKSEYLGETHYKPVSVALNFSTVTRDTFGNATLVRRRSVPKTTQVLYSNKQLVDKLLAIREALNAEPAIWSGLDDADHAYFGALLILGFYRQFSISLDYPDYAVVTLELEEV